MHIGQKENITVSIIIATCTLIIKEKLRYHTHTHSYSTKIKCIIRNLNKASNKVKYAKAKVCFVFHSSHSMSSVKVAVRVRYATLVYYTYSTRVYLFESTTNNLLWLHSRWTVCNFFSIESLWFIPNKYLFCALLFMILTLVPLCLYSRINALAINLFFFVYATFKRHAIVNYDTY